MLFRALNIETVNAADRVLAELEGPLQMNAALPLPVFAIPLLIFGILFYIQESADEAPSLFRTAVFLLAAVEAIISMALT